MVVLRGSGKPVRDTEDPTALLLGAGVANFKIQLSYMTSTVWLPTQILKQHPFAGMNTLPSLIQNDQDRIWEMLLKEFLLSS